MFTGPDLGHARVTTPAAKEGAKCPSSLTLPFLPQFGRPPERRPLQKKLPLLAGEAISSRDNAIRTG